LCGASVQIRVSICCNSFAAFSTNLTRRANQVHADIIARSSKPAPETAAGFFISEIGRRRAREHASLSRFALPHARRRPSLFEFQPYWPARANALVGGAR
jgi:hypothetical protein